LVGDFTGAGYDTVAVWRDENAGDGSEWVQLAGDWDGDGIDTFGAVYVPTGDLVDAGRTVFASRAAAASAAPGSTGPVSLFGADNAPCWTFTKKVAETVHSFQYPGGGCMFVIMTVFEEWKCCPLTFNPKGPAICGKKFKFKTDTVTGGC
jgi:hypothetical protein